jgi:haloacetate dehalogenase
MLLVAVIRKLEVEMSNPDRREFMTKSIALALAPAMGGDAMVSAKLLSQRTPIQRPSEEFFPGFKREQIKTSGATLNAVYGGKGAPVLLLHGIPQTHLLWRKVAPLLAQDFFLVATDLRGYGDSSKPAGGDDHIGYSKRAMAQDQVEVMRHLGFQKFAVVGHDRGGRAAHRMALDYPDLLTKLVILDIVPTYLLYQNITKQFATVFFHWFLLVQSAPFPETLVGNSAEYFLKSLLYWLGGETYSEKVPGWVGEAAYQEYLRCFRDPAALHALCEDYRAAASIDLVHDEADLSRKIQCPLLVLWSEKGPFHRMYNVLETWQDRAMDARGKPLPTGHFLPEQVPQELAGELRAFLTG